MVVKFLTRPGCTLCERAMPVVEKAVRRAGMTLAVVDIDTDDRLVSDYGMRIPVVLAPDRTVIAEGRIEDGAAMRRALKKTTW